MAKKVISAFGNPAVYVILVFIIIGSYKMNKNGHQSFSSNFGEFKIENKQELKLINLSRNLRKFYKNELISEVEPVELTKAELPINRFEKSTSKIILMWNTWHYSMTEGALRNAQCPVTSCIFTRDESLINQSDIVVLYIQTLTDFPVNRLPHQRFVFAQLESPITHDLPKILNDYRIRYEYFNWTMTYRWDSDIVHRGEYGYLVKKSTTNSTGIRARILRDWSIKMNNSKTKETESERTSVADDNYSISNIVKRKSKLVAWFVSHCSTPIKREEYVRQLRQYINVDIFGSCSNRDCPSSCDDILQTDYKFYLAFENSWCPDYVTEKFYRPLMHNTVPIAMGGANYNKFAPPHSYVNARDFKSPKELAEYLLMLNRTDKLYAKYFEWKADFDIIQDDNFGLCDLCQMAHDRNLKPKSYQDIKHWWVDQGGCETNVSNNF